MIANEGAIWDIYEEKAGFPSVFGSSQLDIVIRWKHK
jgi:hypothetical protein